MALKAHVRTSPYDLADHLVAADDVRHLVAAAFEDGDPGVITKALGAAARSQGMVALAKETGLSRESLYKALAEDGNPEFRTVMKVVRALDLQVTVKAAARKLLGAAAASVPKRPTRAGAPIRAAVAAKTPTAKMAGVRKAPATASAKPASKTVGKKTAISKPKSPGKKASRPRA